MVGSRETAADLGEPFQAYDTLRKRWYWARFVSGRVVAVPADEAERLGEGVVQTDNDWVT